MDMQSCDIFLVVKLYLIIQSCVKECNGWTIVRCWERHMHVGVLGRILCCTCIMCDASFCTIVYQKGKKCFQCIIIINEYYFHHYHIYTIYQVNNKGDLMSTCHKHFVVIFSILLVWFGIVKIKLINKNEHITKLGEKKSGLEEWVQMRLCVRELCSTCTHILHAFSISYI